MLITLLLLTVIISPVAIFVLNQPKFGKIPRGKSLKRIKQSPNFRNGQFQNLHETPRIVCDDNSDLFKILLRFVFGKTNPGSVPENAMKTLKTDLRQLSKNENVLVWFGHSSYFMQIDGKRFLVDPVFFDAAPFRWINKAFKGTRKFSVKDLPDIDCYLITHDHWDHLDWNVVKRIKNRTKTFVCGLGVGAHLEYWGVNPQKIKEMDWGESIDLENFRLHCTPARHFSGRGLRSNRSLWCSFLLETPSLNLFLSGDGGYDSHFAEIGKRFHIDWAILENGQYNERWRFIHTMPDELAKEAKELKTKHILTVHHSKYALSEHDWDEPLKNEAALEKQGLPIVHAIIGEKVALT